MKRPRVITDNAHAESFFKTLKAEIFQRPVFDTEEKISEAFTALHASPQQDHSALGFRSPVDYTQKNSCVSRLF